MMTPTRMAGTVIRLLRNRGFGFIRGEDGLSRFFEAKEVYPPVDFDLMHEGQRVTFVPMDGGEAANPKSNKLRAGQVWKAL